MLLFHFNQSHALPVNHYYVQRIARATSPQSMNVGVRGTKIMDNFHYARSAILEVIHMCRTANQNLRRSKEGKWDTKEDKGKSMMQTL